MSNKPTVSEKYEWETGKPAGIVRNVISQFQRRPKATTLAFATAVAASVATYETVETVIDPFHPNFIGSMIAPLVLVNNFNHQGSWLTRYDEYIRDVYNRNPELAYQHLEQIYSIKHTGNMRQTAVDFIYRDRTPAKPKPQSEQYVGRDVGSPLIMFMTGNAYGQEGSSITDLIGLETEAIESMAP